MKNQIGVKYFLSFSINNNAKCTQARKVTHGLDGQHQDVDKTGVAMEESMRMTPAKCIAAGRDALFG